MATNVGASVDVAFRGVSCGGVSRLTHARQRHWQPFWSRVIVTGVVMLGLLVGSDRDAQGQLPLPPAQPHWNHSHHHGTGSHGHHHHRGLYSGVYSTYRPSIYYQHSFISYSPSYLYGYYSPYGSFTTGVIGPQLYGSYSNFGYPYGGYPYGSLTNFGGGYPWGGPIYSGGYAPAPVFASADTLFGPGAVRRFMGVDPPIGPVPGINAPVLPQFPQLAGAQPVPLAPPPAPGNNQPARPVVTGQARARAQEHLNAGDQHFRGGRYHIALQRYKDATTSAPDSADGFMRQGWALLAMGQYDVAGRAIRKGLQLKPDWHTSAFRLQDIYSDGVSKGAHRDALERAARDRDTDPQLSFLAGLFAWADRDMDRARSWLTKAKQHEIGDATYITTFMNILPQQLPAPAPAPAPATNGNPPVIAPPANGAAPAK